MIVGFAPAPAEVTGRLLLNLLDHFFFFLQVSVFAKNLLFPSQMLIKKCFCLHAAWHSLSFQDSI